ncbi:MAG: hypothetical protein QNL02_18690 [Paracoccaceae bacterium]
MTRTVDLEALALFSVRIGADLMLIKGAGGNALGLQQPWCKRAWCEQACILICLIANSWRIALRLPCRISSYQVLL